MTCCLASLVIIVAYFIRYVLGVQYLPAAPIVNFFKRDYYATVVRPEKGSPMAQLTPLFRECRAVFDSLPHAPGGSYGRDCIADGTIIDACVGTDRVMSLYQHPDPRRERIILFTSPQGRNATGGEPHIVVYADTTQWPLNKRVTAGSVTMGGSVAEAQHLLGVITRRRDASAR